MGWSERERDSVNMSEYKELLECDCTSHYDF